MALDASFMPKIPLDLGLGEPQRKSLPGRIGYSGVVHELRVMPFSGLVRVFMADVKKAIRFDLHRRTVL